MATEYRRRETVGFFSLRKIITVAELISGMRQAGFPLKRSKVFAERLWGFSWEARQAFSGYRIIYGVGPLG